jgi:ParB family chromosome partitioning protein
MSSADDKQRKALGKGLSALLPARTPQVPVSPASPASASPGSATPAPPPSRPQSLPLDSIRPNQAQPRTVFQPERLQELAASIQAHGVIQPIIVRETQTGPQIVAGERRWRAAKIAGLTEIPVIVQDVADRAMLEIALIENLQREDLNPIETAKAYDHLNTDYSLTQEEISRRTGKDRASIANYLRLLKLPAEVQSLIEDHQLSMGHAKAVLGLDNPLKQILFSEMAVVNGWTVRHLERLVQDETGQTQAKRDAKEALVDPNVRAAEQALEEALGTRVRVVISGGGASGRFEILFTSEAERDRIYNQLVATRN